MDLRKITAKAMENWPVKVLSIGLAIILFIFHRMSILETRYFSIPLNIEHPGSMMPSNPYPRMIRVSIRGEANNIYPVMEDDLEAYVDMSGIYTRGTYTVPVQWRTRASSYGFDALQITVEPMEISFVLDYRISKIVPLLPNFRGELDSGFTMSSFSLVPENIIIDGPSELMTGVYELYTDLINLDGRSNNFSESISILNINPLISIRGNGIADFHGIINPIIPARNIPGIPIAITGLSELLSAMPEISSVDLHLEGDNQEIIDDFTPSPDFVRIDASGIVETGTYVLSIHTGLEPGIRFRTEPNEIRVMVFLREDE